MNGGGKESNAFYFVSFLWAMSYVSLLVYHRRTEVGACGGMLFHLCNGCGVGGLGVDSSNTFSKVSEQAVK